MTATRNITDLNALQTPQTDDVLLIVERLSSTSTEAKQITWGNLTEAIQDIVGGLIVSDTNSPSTITVSYDDAGAELVARVQPDTTVQRVEVTDGTTVATKKRINIDDGVGITATVTDDVANNQSVVTLKNSGIVNASTNALTGTSFTVLSGTTLQNDGSKTVDLRPIRMGSSKITATLVESDAGIELDIDPSQIPIGSLDATVQLPVSKGGTGASTAATARTNLGAAKTGVNSDISSLSGLTTPLSVAQGGTGSNTASGALSSLNGLNSVVGVGQVGEQLVYQASVLSSGQYRAELKGIKPTSENYITVTTENSDIALGVNPNVIFDAVNGTRTINNARIQNAANPVNGQDLATKSYVDATSSGLAVKDSVRVATTSNLNATYTSSNFRLTLNNYGALSIDNVSLILNDRVLVKDQTDQRRNGIYTVLTVGNSTTYAVLERATDMNQSSEVATGAFTFVQEGNLSANRSFVQTATNVTLDTDNITFSVFGDYTIGVNTITNNKFAQVSSNIVKGRASTGTGDVEDVSADSLIDIINTATTSQLDSSRVVQVPIANASITNLKLADVNQGTLKGRPSSETEAGAPTDLNADQIIQIINSASTQTINSARLVIPAIQAEEVTNTMLAHVNQYRVKGRVTQDSGDVEDLTPDNLITLINQASTNSINTAQTVKHSLASNEVTNDKLDDMSGNTVKGRISTDGDPQDLTADQVLTIVNGATGSLSAARISAGSVSLDKIASVGNNTVIGRTATGSGEVSALSADNVLTIVNAATGTLSSARIANNSVADSKLGNINQYQVKGRITSGAGNVESLSADNLIQIINQATSQTIDTSRTVDHGTADDSITNAKLANIAQYRVKGRVASGVGDPTDLTSNDIITIINQGSTAINTARLTIPAIADNSITNSLLADIDQNTILGRVAENSGDPSALTADELIGLINSGTSSTINSARLSIPAISSGGVGTSNLADSAVTTGKIAANAVTSAKIAASNVTTSNIADLNVTTGKIANDAITSAKIADDAVTSAALADNAVNTGSIVDDAVTTDKIASENITNALLADSSVTNAKLSASAVTAAKISDGNVTTIKIADDAVTSAKIADGNVGTVALASSAVTTIKIADDAVTNSKIGAGAVGTTELSNNAVTASKITNGNVTTDKIADVNVTAAKIANSNVTTAKIADLNVTTAKIANSNVTTAKIADSNVTSAKIAANAVTFAKIQDIATGTLLGRATAGSGDVQTITCTAAGRALLDDASAAAQRTTLGLGSLATASSISTASITGLGSLATQDSVSASNVTGLGSLATANSVSSSNVTGLGSLATLDAVDSEQIVANAVNTFKIAPGVVTNAKMSNMNGRTVKGNASASAGGVADLSANDLYGILGTGTIDASFVLSSGAPIILGKRGGNVNTCLGVNAGQSVSVSSFNGNAHTLIGYHAGLKITSGQHNVCVGAISGGQTTGSNCVSIAWFSGGARRSTMAATGSNNISIGQFSNGLITTAADNVSVGHNSGANLTTGINNVFIGSHAGTSAVFSGSTGTVNIETTNNNICIGHGTGPSANNVNGEIVLGNFAQSVLRCNVSGLSAISDRRDKTNIEDIPVGLDFVNQLRPVKFQWNHRTTENALNGTLAAGFIAQEAKETCTNNNADYLNLVNDNQPEALEMNPTNIIPVLVKAVQELSAEVTSLRSQLEALS